MQWVELAAQLAASRQALDLSEAKVKHNAEEIVALKAQLADATNWKKFAPTMRPTSERIAALTAACAAKGVEVVAAANT